MGADLKNNDKSGKITKIDNVVVVKSKEQKVKFELRAWTKEEVEKNRSTAYKYAI